MSDSMIPTEHQEQVRLMQWANLTKFNDEPIGLYLVASQNGAKLPRFKTAHGFYSPQANKLIAEGLKKGFPDLQLLIPAGPYHGLFIELKRAKKSLSKISKEQKEWIERLNRQGYQAKVCYGADEAIETIKGYLCS